MEDYAGDPVPGLGQLVSGSLPTDPAPLNLDLNNPRTHDDDSDNIDLDLFTIVGDVINRTITGSYDGGSPVTPASSTEDVSDALFNQIGYRLQNNT